MKTQLKLWLLAATFVLTGSYLFAQTDKPYKEGTVWQVSFIKTKANMGEEYLKGLSANWVKIHNEAVKQGLIVSYKVLTGDASNPQDWDIMLMVEYKNMAVMDDTSTEAKWETLMKSFVGSEDQQKSLNQQRGDIREIYGSKLVREVIFK